MNVLSAVTKLHNAISRTQSGLSYLTLVPGSCFLFVACGAFAQENTGPDPLGDIGTVATDSITLIFNVIGALLVVVGLSMFIGSAVAIARGRSTAGDLLLMFVMAAALVLIGVAFVAFGLTQTASISAS